jgi:DNA-binding GntR family transcriptional regulator
MPLAKALSTFGQSASRTGRSVDFVYDVLKAALLDGALAPGTRLTEDGIAQGLGVSRTPVRDAILQLTSEHLIERIPRQGLRVTHLTPDQIEDLYVTRAVLEGLAARLAAHQMRPRDHVRLRLIQQELENALDSGQYSTLAKINFRFHREILQSASNESLTAFITQIHNSLRRYRVTTMTFPERAQAAMEEHRELIDAIERHDADAAERIAREHIHKALQVRLVIHAEREVGSDSGEASGRGE